MKPTLALTMGDPAGIGPEITLKALQESQLHEGTRIFVVGSRAVLTDMAARLGFGLSFPDLKQGDSWQSFPDMVPIYQVGSLTPDDFELGQVAEVTGRDSVAYVETAAELGKQGLVDAIVTAPINKESLRAAKIAYPGHTEILGVAFASPVETMFVVDRLRIFFLTRHLSLRDAIDAIAAESLLKLLAHAREVLAELGIDHPVIGVAGLNPHAGDGGIFGSEEIERLQPAVREARARGWDVRGPIGADSIFHQALQGKYDAVISLYHDQGHIAAKTYDFNRTVSVTTGLPIIRTSVDHGTAFDIAGQGLADATNMIEAIKVATDMAAGRLARREPAS
jgi:4-phospho-D-threonate 3-dehydrogenase / 4-phospho-D-erythronate 3-dehydrogenase